MKLDLHTHCLEAANFAQPSEEVAEMILAFIARRGLDGIAITDHDSLGAEFAYTMRDVVSRLTRGRTLIIPGLEVSQGPHHIVELYLPDELTFRFIAHPTPRQLRQLEQQSDVHVHMDGIHGIEVENGTYWVDAEIAREFADKHGLLALSNSDAHSLSDIGVHYNEIDLDAIVRAAKERRSSSVPASSPPSSRPVAQEVTHGSEAGE